MDLSSQLGTALVFLEVCTLPCVILSHDTYKGLREAHTDIVGAIMHLIFKANTVYTNNQTLTIKVTQPTNTNSEIPVAEILMLLLRV